MVILRSDINNHSSMHVVISPGDINSYRVNKQREYRTKILQIFFTRNALLERKRYSLYGSRWSTDLQDHSRWM